jgi:serine acetyltransferase
MQPDDDGPAREQFQFMWRELGLMTEGKLVRWLVLFFEPSAGVIVSYRLDRFGHLICGRSWMLLRIFAWPVFFLLRLLGCQHEICFKARIGSGLRIMHPTLGVAIHADAIIGDDCFLNGGNSIGIRKPMKRGELVLGDHLRMGVNSCVLGPVKVGNNVHIGAGAVVISDMPDDVIAVGVPAKFKAKGS